MGLNHEHRKRSKVDVAFLMFEAGMHIYLTIYLISISANLPVILFTMFELSMFFKLLFTDRHNEVKQQCGVWKQEALHHCNRADKAERELEELKRTRANVNAGWMQNYIGALERDVKELRQEIKDLTRWGDESGR